MPISCSKRAASVALVDNGIIDWVLVRNRMSFHSIEQCAPGSDELAAFGSGIAFRVAEGLHDRVIFREFFRSA